VEGLRAIWSEQVAARLKPHAQGLFIEAVIVSVERNVVSLRVPHQALVERARKRSNEVSAVLGDLLDRSIRVDVLDSSAADAADAGDAGDAGETAASPEPSAPATSHEAKVQRIVERFPGSVVVRDDEGTT